VFFFAARFRGKAAGGFLMLMYVRGWKDGWMDERVGSGSGSTGVRRGTLIG
jgi:hypothetical protein